MIALSVMICSFAFRGSLLAQGEAKLSVEEPDYDFGTIYRGNEARHSFTITNSGTATLEITNIRSSCGCTVPSIAKRKLEPGETTKLTAVFDSGRFKGSVTKNIYIYSNDSASPITKLSIHSNVHQDIEVAPASIYFAGLKEGESVQREIEIKNLSGKRVDISEIASTVSSVELQLEKMVLQPDEATLLHLRIPKVEKGMKLTGELTIYNNSHEDQLKIRLYGGLIQ
jgi:hypothetical protein